MKKIVLLAAIVVIAVAAVAFFKKTDKEAFHTVSVQRVEKVFTGLIEGPTKDENKATAQWAWGRDKGFARGDSDDFYSWLKKKGLTIVIKDYQFISSRLVNAEDTANRYVSVRCKINGKELVVIARHKQRLEWGD